MNNIESVKNRIRQMLAISRDDAATEQEVDSAIRFATALMDQHRLSEEDLADEPEDQREAIRSAPKDRAFTVVGKRLHYWETTLANVITSLVGCPHYLNNSWRQARTRAGLLRTDEKGEAKYGKAIVFYGCAEDAWAACELYDELRLLIITMARARYGGVFRGEGGMYCEGFVSGIASKVSAARREETSQARIAAGNGEPGALVLVERRQDLVEVAMDSAKQWLRDDLGIKLSAGTGRAGASGSRGAWSQGRSDGKKTDISRRRTPKIS